MKRLLFLIMIMSSFNTSAKITDIPIIKKEDVVDISCVTENKKLLLQYQGITKLSEKDEIIAFNDNNGNPHVLTKEGICFFTKNGILLK